MTNGIAKTGISQTKTSGIFLATFSGSIATMLPKMHATMSAFAVQPYQVMFGPSPLLAASNPQAKRFVAGWKVNSGQFIKRQIK